MSPRAQGGAGACSALGVVVGEQCRELCGSHGLVWSVLVDLWRPLLQARQLHPQRGLLARGDSTREEFEAGADGQPRIVGLAAPEWLEVAFDGPARGGGAVQRRRRWWRVTSLGPMRTRLVHGGEDLLPSTAPRDGAQRALERSLARAHAILHAEVQARQD